MLVAAFEEFSAFHFIIINSRWAGAPTQEQALKEHLRQRMQNGVWRLSKSADVSWRSARRNNRNPGGTCATRCLLLGRRPLGE